MKIAIQGESGSFHAQAARHYFDQAIEIYSCKQFKEVFSALSSGRVDSAVVAIENSLYGSINEVYDLLSKHALFINGEITLRIEHHLLAVPGSKLSDIKEVYSQAPALAQCVEFLDSNLPKADRIDYFDTAASAKLVAAQKSHKAAAIAGSHAAEIYKLDKLASNIETDKNNYTRFIVLGSKLSNSNYGNSKTSIIFSTEDKPGALYKVMKIFAQANINLTKIESRPILNKAWQYSYYLDFMGNIKNSDTCKVIKKVEAITDNLTILGCYRQGNIINEE